MPDFRIDTPTASDTAIVGKRRHDVDCLRTLALGLLIIYHCVISFQPWARLLYFPQNERSLEWLWPLMAAINVWRIPILFVISGMGVCFAMARRTWRQLLIDRTVRILVPLVFGSLAICPISAFLSLRFYGVPAAYIPNTGHLWFLLNIYLYAVLLIALLRVLDRRLGSISGMLVRLVGRPWGLPLLALPMALEAVLVNPESFCIYFGNLHGWLLGLLCFLLGFALASAQDAVWHSVARARWYALAVAVCLYLVRFAVFDLWQAPNGLTAVESMSWMCAILGFGSLHLNRPFRILGYLGKAVYPVYIIHMPVQFGLASLLVPLTLPPLLKLVLLLVGTLGFSLLCYELLLRRLPWIQPLFGMKRITAGVRDPTAALEPAGHTSARA